jgi:mRNA interferase MazF
MKAGDIALLSIRQSDGQIKKRPILLLRQLPPYNDWLVAGVSSQLHQEAKGFDLVILKTDAFYTQTGLKSSSLVRLGFLDVVTEAELRGAIGELPIEKVNLLLQRLSDRLKP